MIELYEDAAGEWRWRLKARNGLIIADGSEGYATRNNARLAVQRVCRLIRDGRVEIK